MLPCSYLGPSYETYSGAVRGISRGLVYMALSALFFSLMSLFVKLAGRHLPAMEIVFIRSVLTLIFSYLIVRQQGLNPWGNNRKLLFWRGFAGFVALSCFYVAITRLPLADAVVIQYTNPVFTAVLAAYFLREGLHAREVGAMGLSLLGVLLIARPAFLFGGLTTPLDPAGVLAAFTGAVLSATAYVLVRKLRETDHPDVIIFYLPLVSTPGSLPLALMDFVWPRGMEWLLLLAVGVCTQLGQIFLTRGLRLEPAGRATSVTYLQMVFAYLWGILFLGEYPDVWSIAGTACIVIGILLVAMRREHRRVRTPLRG